MASRHVLSLVQVWHPKVKTTLQDSHLLEPWIEREIREADLAGE
jgi:hypothetical protein